MTQSLIIRISYTKHPHEVLNMKELRKLLWYGFLRIFECVVYAFVLC